MVDPRFLDPVVLHEELRACKEQVLIAKLRPRYWLSRFIVALEVLVMIVSVSWFEEASLTAKAISAAGGFGWVLVAGTAACCLIGLVDVLVNDLMPHRFTLPSAIKWRHLGFMGMSLQLAALGLLIVFSQGFTTLVLAYWLNAALACALTFLDAFARYPRSCPT